MKKLLILFVLFMNLVSCNNRKSDSVIDFCSESRELSQKVVRYYFSDMKENASERTQFIGKSLKNDRDFMLSLFSQDFSAAVFSSSTKYTSPKIDYCKISDSDGVSLSEHGTNRNFDNSDAQNCFAVINDSLWIVMKYEDESFSAITATLVKNEDFDKLKNVLGKDILVLFNMFLTNSTAEIKDRSIVLNSDTLIIDGDKFASMLYSATDNIDILVFDRIKK